MKYLVTGVSGFIGFSIAKQLLKLGHTVVGIDNHNAYYDISLKQARLNQLLPSSLFEFHQLCITNAHELTAIFKDHHFDRVIHLAAQAGVRHSIDNPVSYGENNLMGYLNILEACRKSRIAHFIYASSSSVYGLNNKTPFSCHDNVDHPVSLYAATKRANELMAHSYSHLYNMPTTGLRFFTVYGPWGRPDMAPFIFTKKILNNQTININNNGEMWRDFTYIDDIVEGVIRIADVIPFQEKNIENNDSPARSSAPYRIYNIGHGSPVNLMSFIQEIEKATNKVATKHFREMQPGDVYQTYADTQDLFDVINYTPKVSITEGVPKFVDWFKYHYQHKDNSMISTNNNDTNGRVNSIESMLLQS